MTLDLEPASLRTILDYDSKYLESEGRYTYSTLEEKFDESTSFFGGIVNMNDFYNGLCYSSTQSTIPHSLHLHGLQEILHAFNVKNSSPHSFCDGNFLNLGFSALIPSASESGLLIFRENSESSQFIGNDLLLRFREYITPRIAQGTNKISELCDLTASLLGANTQKPIKKSPRNNIYRSLDFNWVIKIFANTESSIPVAMRAKNENNVLQRLSTHPALGYLFHTKTAEPIDLSFGQVLISSDLDFLSLSMEENIDLKAYLFAGGEEIAPNFFKAPFHKPSGLHSSQLIPSLREKRKLFGSSHKSFFDLLEKNLYSLLVSYDLVQYKLSHNQEEFALQIVDPINYCHTDFEDIKYAIPGYLAAGFVFQNCITKTKDVQWVVDNYCTRLLHYAKRNSEVFEGRYALINAQAHLSEDSINNARSIVGAEIIRKAALGDNLYLPQNSNLLANVTKILQSNYINSS